MKTIAVGHLVLALGITNSAGAQEIHHHHHAVQTPDAPASFVASSDKTFAQPMDEAMASGACKNCVAC